MRQYTALFAALGLFSTIQACSGDPDAPGGEMKIRKECLETVCGARAKQNADACSRCLSACSGASYNCDSSRACSFSCGSRDCDSEACQTEGFKVVLPNNPSAELLAACNREFTHVRECGYKLEGSCATFAAVELPARATNYDCVASLECASLTDKDAVAACEPAVSTFGDELCAKMNDKCPGSCSSDQQELLNLEGAWLRPDVMSTGSSCANQESCSDAQDCLSAFLKAVR